MNAKTKLPSPEYLSVIEPGGIKKIKSESRRSDSQYLIDPTTLHVDPQYNVRVRTPEYLDYIRQLADDMIEHGYDPGQPITAMVGKVKGEDVLVIRAGNTRREAAIIAISEGAQFTQVPVIIRPKTDNQVDQTVDLVRSNNGRPLTAYETSIVVKRLTKMELSEAEIARRLSFSPSYVNGLALLAGAPNKLAMFVVEEKVAAAVAIDLIRKHGYEGATDRIAKSLAAAAATGGKAKVTPANLPDAAFNRAIKKRAPVLLEAAEVVRSDPGYASLSSETRERLDALIEEFSELRKQAA